ncbi:poly-gamma-glutamate synthesis protein (capsule biosynthesis protein) [Lipingzhangella halophila]|uniref:Poly-gamma-glutamate synthesis protein (Capsule biosynthesis protein) n=1 Tax=Lipingzhangella halophila TaxID=1783352 RepID=A0A7W7W3C1_9ACTN|nr:CapA family protein [Lipingzhangella halophila]MBB4932892.1 poly-gamma-glutamate synthesis protein (capsule biosynthesis protein) [Lipingzhangella halophila]
MITLSAVGDVGPEREDVDSLFANVASEIRSADLAFMQLEMTLTTRGQRVPQVRHTSKADPRAASAFRRAGFDLVSWASNHALDWGFEGFRDTIEALEAAELTPLGVGEDVEKARRPRITEVDGVRVAVLACCSILPEAYWATENRPGVVPLRAFTVFEPLEPDQPGTPHRMRTFPHPGDLAALVTDIRAARELADVVVVSAHWGIHFTHAEIADYQRAVAHAAVDAGADLIIGHHAHILKGIEVYRGKAIFYSLGNFAIELPMDAEHAARPSFRHLLSLHPGWEPDIGGIYNFPPDSRKSMVLRCEMDRSGVHRVGFRPVHIDRMAVPELLEPGDPRFAEVVEYVTRVSDEQGLPVRLAVEGGLVTVT